jgi:hypothetical protein
LASVVEVQRELLLLVEANVEREGEVREWFEKRPIVWLPKSDGGRVDDDEELVTPGKVGNADVLLKGVDVSVSEDADKVVDEDVSDSAEVVEDGVSSTGSGSKPERDTLGKGRDTLGNTSPSEGGPAVRPAGKPTAVGVATESKVKVSTLVTAPVASM